MLLLLLQVLHFSVVKNKAHRDKAPSSQLTWLSCCRIKIKPYVIIFSANRSFFLNSLSALPAGNSFWGYLQEKWIHKHNSLGGAEHDFKFSFLSLYKYCVYNDLIFLLLKQHPIFQKDNFTSNMNVTFPTKMIWWVFQLIFVG